MKEFKSGFVTIIGKTNVGKSTLINTLVGEKIAAVVNKSQTTRTAIKAIVNRENAQIIFIDTPGIHKPKNKLGEVMLETAYKAAEDVDIILFMIDVTHNKITKGDSILLEKLKEYGKKTILIINKTDKIEKEKILEIIQLYKDKYDFEAIIPICAIEQKEKEKILNEIEKRLPNGPAYYDVEEYTDQTSRQIVEEMIREKALKLLQEEVPHGIYVEVEKMKKSKTKKGEKIYNIDACIYCTKKSHKGIIIGKEGSMLKKIGSAARYEIETIFDTKVNLSLWVKVKEEWQNENNVVNKYKLQ